MNKERVSLPIALTIAGTDSGGGAGVQADLKTFAALGVHGCAAITCLTAQNPKGVRAILSSPAEFLRQQLIAVFSELPPVAAKTGMLYSAELIHVLASFLKEHPVKLVLDPVMISTSGSELLQVDAVQTMCEELFPLADLLTPNLDESVRLLGHAIENQKELQSAARELYDKFGRPILAKGGHLRDSEEAIDISGMEKRNISSENLLCWVSLLMEPAAPFPPPLQQLWPRSIRCRQRWKSGKTMCSRR